MSQFGELALIVGDFHIPTRALDVPDKFKDLLLPNKVHNVICTGNVGSKETVDWLKGLSNSFYMSKGDYDDLPGVPETKIFTIGKFKIGLVHGHQVVPWGDEEALANYQRELDCDILIYGHTHQNKISSLNGKFFVNPGSATGAYSAFKTETNPSFIILEFNGDNVGAFIYEYVNEKVVITKGSLKDLGEKETV